MLRALLYAYMIGGITFIPLVLITICLFIYLSSPYTPPNLDTSTKAANDVESSELDPTTIHESYKVGWLTIRSRYTANAGDGTYVGMVMQGYRNLMDNKKGPERRPKDVFFAVLRHDTLLLYESEDQIGCKQIIKMSLHEVDLYPKGLEEGELFLKRNAIRLKKKGEALQIPDDKSGTPAEYYIFHASPSEKEDWYFALVAAQHLGLEGGGDAKSELDSQSLRHLLMTLQSNELQKDVAWLNGIIGRIFLALHQTRFAEDYFVDKLMKKISRVKKPSFLSDISVRKVNVGGTIPYFTKPKLLDLDMDGTLTGECNVSYAGEFRIEIQTVASLNLSTKLKPMNVTLVLAVVLKQWHGRMKVLIKPQPSNRIWFGFHSMPKIDIAIEPIVSSRQIRYPVILKAIEARINEMIVDSVVLPNMDDIPFFPTLDEERRGGIWSSTRRKDEDTVKTADVSGLEDDMLDTSSLPLQDKEEALSGQSSVSSPGTNHDAEGTDNPSQHRRGWFSRASNSESYSSRGHSNNNNVNDISRSGADKHLLPKKDVSPEAKVLRPKEPTLKQSDDSLPKHVKEIVKQKGKNIADNAQTKYQESKRGLMVVPAPDNEDDAEIGSSSIPAINLDSSIDDSSLDARPNLSQSVATATSAVRRWGVNMYQRRKNRIQDPPFTSQVIDSASNSKSDNESKSQHVIKGSDRPSAVSTNSKNEPLRVQPGVELSTRDKKQSDALKLLAETSNARANTTILREKVSSSLETLTQSPLQDTDEDTGSAQSAELASISSAPAIGSKILLPSVVEMPRSNSIASDAKVQLPKVSNSDSDLNKVTRAITSGADSLARPPPIYSSEHSHVL